MAVIRSIRRTVPVTEHEMLSSRVRRLRAERGWSQAELADAAEIHRLTVCRAENQCSVQAWVLARIATALGVTMNDLFYGEAS